MMRSFLASGWAKGRRSLKYGATRVATPAGRSLRSIAAPTRSLVMVLVAERVSSRASWFAAPK